MAKINSGVRSPFTDAIFKPKGGSATPAPNPGLNKSTGKK